MACAVEGCTSHSGRKELENEYIAFHRFPKDETMRIKWVECIRKPNWTPANHNRICSRHFADAYYMPNNVGKYRRLTEGAIPTLNLPSKPVVTVEEPLSDKPTTSNVMKRKDNNKENEAAVNVSQFQRTEEASPLDLEENFSYASKRRKLTPDLEKIHELEMAVAENKMKIVRLEKELERVKKVSKRRLRKIHTLMKKHSRVAAKNSQLFDTLMEKITKENIELEHKAVLESVNKNEVVKRFLQKQEGETLSREYSLEVKKFAVTLHYLSPRAYTFLRDRFENVLPHPKTISTWYKGIDCNPGFTTESFEAIRSRIDQNPGKKLYCALSIDEMSIRKFVEWDSHNLQYFGYVNMGLDMDTDCVAIATQALVFMATCINDTWKIPVGYCLISSINAEQKSLLVEKCIHLLSESGIAVPSLTFDGAANNIAMASHLGCNVSAGDVSFHCAGSEVCLWPDPCHNIKLVRNAFADKKIFIDEDGNTVSWHYIELLLSIQEKERLHLGNKLKKDHIDFVKQKMKVRLAAQLLSCSVADALQYCQERGIPGFENCAGTIKFLRIFNNLFDIFNSRNMRAKGFKKALATFNYEETATFFDAAEAYIKKLKTADNTLLINSNRKTGFNGFLVCIKSLKKMFHDLVMNGSLHYLCTYKMSQDHIELFFGAIRSRCGFNNNPTARTFQAAYKRLLVHAEFKDGSSGNCVPLEKIAVLNWTSKKSLAAINNSSGNIGILRDSTEDPSEETISAQMNISLALQSLSDFSTDIVEYIAGFVVKKLKTSLKCETCLESLSDAAQTTRLSLISVKDRGGLVKPSKDVSKVCEITERVLREQKSKIGSERLGARAQVMFIANKVFGSFQFSSIFNNLVEHSLEQDFDENHRHLMIKLICRLYLSIRIQHITKRIYTPTEKIRQHLSKTILFKGQ